ncbi:MAG: hypothetical protein K9M10_01815 [Candidatus Pacebacteria bacterium]|nr:hypothetical protein [Candidatus Paceibacterota bacterium]MCF7857200.1 hypothetical protein [Candidatus Paceibacterota bacterium]
MKKITIIFIILVILGICSYFTHQYYLGVIGGIPELPVITPAAPSASPEWIKNMKNTFHLEILSVSMPTISFSYANMPPSGVNVIREETGEVVWRQKLTDTEGLSGRTTVTLPNGIVNSAEYAGRYFLQAFGSSNEIYATSTAFYVGKNTSNSQLSVQAKAEPNNIHEKEIITISWSSTDAIGCYLDTARGKGDDLAPSGSVETPIYGAFLPLKIVCHDEKDNVASAEIDLTIK